MIAKRARPSGASAFVALALIAPLVAGGLAVLVAATQSPLESASQTAPVVSVVAMSKRYGNVNVSLTIDPATAATVATQASGTITRLNVGPGSKVANGQVIMVVDSRQVIAYVSASPLYRDVARPGTGDDIKIAQRLLQNLGLLNREHAIDGKVDAATETAIKAYNKKYGYGTANGVLSLASLVWIGPAPVTIAKMSVSLGQGVSPGTAMFDKPAGAGAIAVAETVAVPRDAELQLVVNDIAVPYVPGSGRVTDPAAVTKIAASIGSAPEGTGVIRRTTPIVVGTVPSSAVVTDDAGRICIFPSLTGAPVAVHPVATVPGDIEVMNGTLGLVDLDSALAGQPVLVNPRDVREDLSCG